MPFMPDLDKLKLDKIKEKAELVVLTGKSQAPKPKKVMAEVAKPGPKVVKPSEKPASASAAAKPKPAAAGGGKVVKSGGAKAGGGKPSSAGGKTGASKGKPGSGGGVGMEPDIALEEAEGR